MKWDGEWHITYEVFRDLGIAFAAVLILIYGLVSRVVSIVPDTRDHHGGNPVLAGWHCARSRFDACVFHSDLDDRLHRRRRYCGEELDYPGGLYRIEAGGGNAARQEAVIDAGAIRFRPMMLTAAAVVVGSSVILYDPIFQGLAIALMAGEVVSLLLSRMTVPVLFFIFNRRKRGIVAYGTAV